MTKSFVPSFFSQDLKNFDQFFVGFEDQFNRMTKLHDDFAKNIPNYPPYNIKKTGENTYVIEIAVAGFSKSEIEIELNDDKLIVKGNAQDAKDDYVFKGIGMRDFTRTFALNDQVEVAGAGLVNGMLKIALERIIPEHKKVKKIEVQDGPAETTAKKSTKQYLTEEDL